MASFLSLAFTLHPSEVGLIFALRQAGITGGYSAGLIVSYFAFLLLGYFGLFVVLSFISLILTLFLFTIRKSKIPSLSQQRESSLGYKKVLGIRRVLVTLLNNQITGQVILFAEPTLALKLYHDFGYRENTIQLYILSYALAATVGSIFTLMLGTRVQRRLQLFVANIVFTLGLIFIGPSALFHLPNHPALPAFGLALVGFPKSTILIQSLPDAVEGAIQIYPSQKQEVSNIINTAFISLFGINTFVSPIVSSILTKYCGFRVMMDWLLLLITAVALLYWVSTLYDWLSAKRKYDKVEKEGATQEGEMRTEG